MSSLPEFRDGGVKKGFSIKSFFIGSILIAPCALFILIPEILYYKNKVSMSSMFFCLPIVMAWSLSLYSFIENILKRPKRNEGYGYQIAVGVVVTVITALIFGIFQCVKWATN